MAKDPVCGMYVEEKPEGLGLYISKSIVQAHKGKIWAENNSDEKGTTFAFSLPVISSENTKPIN